MSWRTAKSLLKVKEQINQLAPNRSTAADGTIGDASHLAQGNASDHNPWFDDANGVGVVTALDITHDPENGMDIANLASLLMKSEDPRIKYVIANGQILIPSKQSWASEYGWKWQEYSGDDPHTGHIHISVNTYNYDDESQWNLNMEQKVNRGDIDNFCMFMLRRKATNDDYARIGTTWKETTEAYMMGKEFNDRLTYLTQRAAAADLMDKAKLGDYAQIEKLKSQVSQLKIGSTDNTEILERIEVLLKEIIKNGK